MDPVDHGMGLGAVLHDVELFWQPLLPPEDRLRLPNEEDRFEVNSSGDPNGVDITATKKSNIAIMGRELCHSG